MRAVVLLLCVLVLTSCDRDSPVSPSPINQELTLAPGQTVNVQGADLSVKFTGVTGDSRCPADALCITGGSATVRLEVSAGSGTRRDVAFETGNLQPVTTASVTMELLQLAPYPFSTGPIQPQDYRATIRVKR